MNAPSGFILDSNGNVVDVDPIQVIFNPSMPWQAAHMLVAAYLVGGFLVASVYAVGMLRGRRDRYHYLGFVIAFTVGAIATPIQLGIGDGLARWVYQNQPVKFAALELLPNTESDAPETLLGHLNDNYTVSGGLPIPGLASWLSDPSTGKNTVVQGLTSVPPDQRPTVRQANIVHLCWDIMVGLGNGLVPVGGLVRGVVDLPTPHAADQVVPAGRGSGRPRRGARHGGRLGRNRSRPPAVDRLWAHESRGRGHRQSRRVDHLLRGRDLVRPGRHDDDSRLTWHGQEVPSNPRLHRSRHPVRSELADRSLHRGVREGGGDGRVSTAVAVVLLLAVVAYAIFGGADFGAGFWDLTAGGPERGAHPRATIEHSIGPVWEANHVWLIFIFVILWTSFPEAYASITLTLFVPLTIAALGIVLRGASFAFRKAVVQLRHRRLFGAGFALASVLVPYCMGAVAGGIASGRVPAGGQAGDPVHSWINPTSILGGILAVAGAAYLAAVYLVWDARRLSDNEMTEYFRRRAIISAVWLVSSASLASLCCALTRPIYSRV